jgi:hypothetical protein
MAAVGGRERNDDEDDSRSESKTERVTMMMAKTFLHE